MKKFCTNVFLYRILIFCLTVFLSGVLPHFSFSQVQTLTPVQVDLSANIGGMYVSLPVDYNSNPQKKYPLLVFFHGVGECGNGTTNLSKIAGVGLPRVIRDGKFPTSINVGGENFSYIVICPQVKAVVDLPNNALKTIEYGIKNYRVDEQRIYLTGLSLGGLTSWFYIHTSKSNSEKIAASLLVCPGVDSIYFGNTPLGRQRIHNAVDANLPIWITTNSNDNVVTTWKQIALADSLNRLKINPAAKLTIFQANGHDAWTKTYDPNFKENGMNVYEWFLTHKRGTNTPSPPVSNAGIAQTITLPVNSVTLDGSKSTAAVGIKSYLWTKLSGPSSGTISSPSAASTKVVNLQEGTYEFQLVITDNNGKTSTAKVTVKVNPAPLPPVASAGNSQTITLPSNSVTLNGSASTAPSGTIASYQWSKVSGPAQGALSGTSSVSVNATNLVQGVYVFQIKIVDSNGNSATANVSITVNAAPVPPVAEAGDGQIITLPTDVALLDGSASTAPAGNITKYEWSKLSGPSGGIISNSGSVKTSVTGLKEGVYEFQLKVTDNLGSSAVDIVTITVKAAPPPPVANAGNNISIQLPEDVITLDGSTSSSPGGTITSYVWSKISGPSEGVINDPANATTAVTNLGEGIYVFELKVTDNNGNSSIATVTVTVKAAPLPPVANAGADQTITLPVNDVMLDAGGSTAPSGSIVSYEWSKLSGPVEGVLSSASISGPQVTGLAEGVYVFQVKVTDNNGQSSVATVTINVKAAFLPPVSNAGSAQTIVLPQNSITLDGSESTAPSGNIVSYEWKKLNGGTAVIADAGLSSTQVSGLAEGVYEFELKVTDDNGLSATSTVTVTVKAAPLPPVVNAGNAQTIVLPENSVTLDGSKSTASGTIISYEWIKLSGPADDVIAAPDQSVTTVTGLLEGVYIYELKVTDDNGLSSKATITITVTAGTVLPGADAGSDIEIALPVNSVTLDGSGSTAASGNISSFKWTKASGPSGVIITDPSNVSTLVSNLAEGIYEFELEIKDDNGQISTDKVTVTVKAAFQPPVANAGSDIEITLPLNTVSLDGSGSSSPSGSIAGYAWTKLSGPSGEVINDASASGTTVSNLSEGVYIFELKITDSSALTSTSTVTVTVKAAPLPPVADAGADQTIILPVNSITLSAGNSTAPSGSIVSYTWTKTSGPSGETIANPSGTTTAVTNLGEGIYVFELKVTDNNSNSSTATVTVIVKAAPLPPVANAGADQTITLPVNDVMLDAGGSTAPSGSIISYEWSKSFGPVDGVLSSASISGPQVTDLAEGVYVFQVKVTDSNGQSSVATVTITVKAALLPPVSNAGSAQTIVLPQNSVTLDGGKSTAPSGNIVSYEWKKLNGGTAVIADAGLSSTQVSGLAEGVYEFELKVTDNNGLSATSTVTVTVKAAPPPPVANAGDAQTIVLPLNTITLDAGKSSAAAGSIVNYEWSLVSGPNGGKIADAEKSKTTVTDLVEGIYQFQIKVTDNTGASATAIVVITVKAPPAPPVADAGLAQTITLPVNTVTLNATLSSAPAGVIKSFVWTKISGPSAGKITNPANGMTTVTDLVAGTYQFQVKVTDNNSNSSLATVTITVNPAVVKPPVADAGQDQQIQLPANVIQLDGSKSYAREGSIKSYKWGVVSAPDSVSLLNATTPTPIVLSAQEGLYTFRLIVTDTYNSVDSADVNVIVLKNVPNEPPVVYIQSDSTISLPQTTALLDGSASYSLDKTIVKYEWSIVSGPSGAIIEDPANAVTSVSSLTEGEYEFGLKVTDSKGEVSVSVVKVVVNNPGGRPDLSQQIVQVYPNPAQNIVHIKLSGESKGRTMIDIYDVSGKRVMHKEVIKDNNSLHQTIDVAGLTKGIYFVELIIDYSYRINCKLIKL